MTEVSLPGFRSGNGIAVATREIPNLAMAEFGQAILDHVTAGRRVSALFAAPEGAALRMTAALSDDGHPITDSNILRRALQYSKKFDLAIMVHCQDEGLFCGGYRQRSLFVFGIINIDAI